MEKSEFNDAIGGINRINASFVLAQESKMNFDAFLWCRALDMIYMELVNYMKDTEREHFRDWSRTAMDFISENRIKTGQMPKILYNMLMDFEQNLRRIYDRSGLAGKKQETGADIFKQ